MRFDKGTGLLTRLKETGLMLHAANISPVVV